MTEAQYAEYLAAMPADARRGHIEVRSESTTGGVRFVAWLGGKVVGETMITVLPLVHDMEIEPGTLQRKIADALLQYASGYVKASGFQEAAVLVAPGNVSMQRYVEERTTQEDPAVIYMMAVR